MKIAFLGTSAFAVPALAALAEAGHDVACVYTRAPRPAGRGQQERKTPVHLLADELGLTVRTPRTLKSDEEAQAFKALDLDAAVVVSYGHILPKSFLDAPLLGCIMLHKQPDIFVWLCILQDSTHSRLFDILNFGWSKECLLPVFHD